MDSLNFVLPPLGNIQIVGWDELERTLEGNAPIGRGATSMVYRAQWEGNIVAVKVIHNCPEAKDVLKRELDVLVSLRHSKLVRLHAVCNDVPPARGMLALVFEYMERSSVDNFIRELACSGISFTNSQKLMILLDISDAMRFLHSRRCTHRDLKSGNVLMNKKYKVKLSDFGLSGLHSLHI